MILKIIALACPLIGVQESNKTDTRMEVINAKHVIAVSPYRFMGSRPCFDATCEATVYKNWHLRINITGDQNKAYYADSEKNAKKAVKDFQDQLVRCLK